MTGGVERDEPHPTRTGDGPRLASEVDLTRVEAEGEASVELAGSPPPLLGRYSLLRKLGEGGMGIVYSAFDEELDRKVAIKLMRVRGGEGMAAQRMFHEAKAMAMLSHPNVVHVYDVQVVRGQVFLAMEFVAGQTLRDWLHNGGGAPRSWSDALAMYLQAGQGLAAAHAAGLVHRDFKPKSRSPLRTSPLPPSGWILANRGVSRRGLWRVMPPSAAGLATAWQRPRVTAHGQRAGPPHPGGRPRFSALVTGLAAGARRRTRITGIGHPEPESLRP